MRDMLNALFGVIKQQFIKILSELRKLTNPTYWRTTILAKISNFFTRILNVRARNKKDYYTVLGWMIAKRVAFALMIIIGVVSLYYLLVVNPVFNIGNAGVRTYSYDSIPLRYTKGEVKIKARQGYVAYEGNVAKGKVTGQGILYGPEGNILYDGTFENNMYSGTGKLYYSNSALKYEGEFEDNLYSGHGVLYRATGTEEYDGNFSQGMKNGSGSLYDLASKKIYTGTFLNDEIVYSELVDISTSDVANFYTGNAVIYSDDDYYTVYMPDIDALYFGENETDSLEGDITVEAVYVLKDTYKSGTNECHNISEVNKVLGAAAYEGNITINMPEAVAVDYLSKEDGSACKDPGLEVTEDFDNVMTVTGYDSSYSMYVYSYDLDGMSIMFFCNDNDGYFVMYQITKNS